MKKKLLCGLLTVALVSSMVLSGCGSKEEPPQVAPEQKDEPVVEEVVEEPVEEVVPETEEEGGRGDYISFCPSLTIAPEKCDTYDEDGNWLIEAYYPTVTAFNGALDMGPVNESLESSCNYYEHCVADWTNQINEMLDGGDELLANLERSADMPLTSATVDVFPSRVDENVISLLEYYYYFAGGAHPSYDYESTIIDVNTGKDLYLEDVIVDMDGFASYAVAKAMDEAEEYAAGGDMNFFDDLEDGLSNILDHKWYFDAAGIEFIYNPEEIAPYAAGMITFLMPYDELLSYMDTSYIPNIEDGFLAMPSNQQCQATVIDGMMVSAESEGHNGEATISAGDMHMKITDNGYIQEAYLFKRTEKQYVFANFYDNDRLNFSVFDVTGGNISEIYTQTDVGFRRDTLSEDDFKLFCDTDESYEEILSLETVIPFE